MGLYLDPPENALVLCVVVCRDGSSCKQRSMTVLITNRNGTSTFLKAGHHKRRKRLHLSHSRRQSRGQPFEAYEYRCHHLRTPLSLILPDPTLASQSDFQTPLSHHNANSLVFCGLLIVYCQPVPSRRIPILEAMCLHRTIAPCFDCAFQFLQWPTSTDYGQTDHFVMERLPHVVHKAQTFITLMIIRCGSPRTGSDRLRSSHAYTESPLRNALSGRCSAPKIVVRRQRPVPVRPGSQVQPPEEIDGLAPHCHNGDSPDTGTFGASRAILRTVVWI